MFKFSPKTNKLKLHTFYFLPFPLISSFDLLKSGEDSGCLSSLKGGLKDPDQYVTLQRGAPLG